MQNRSCQSILRVRNALLLLAVVLAAGVALTGWKAFFSVPDDPGTEESGQPQQISVLPLVPVETEPAPGDTFALDPFGLSSEPGNGMEAVP